MFRPGRLFLLCRLFLFLVLFTCLVRVASLQVNPMRQSGRTGGRDPKKLRIYDPFYCAGSVVKHLAELGFSRVYNKCEERATHGDSSYGWVECVNVNPPLFKSTDGTPTVVAPNLVGCLVVWLPFWLVTCLLALFAAIGTMLVFYFLVYNER